MTTTLFALGLAVLATIICGFSPVCFKMGTKNIMLSLRECVSLRFILRNRMVFLGIALSIIAAILNVIALRYGELSVIAPIGGLSYIWACFFSIRLLGERMTAQKWCGVAAIMAGVILVAG
jgi:uncharacterized membrane protein